MRTVIMTLALMLASTQTWAADYFFFRFKRRMTEQQAERGGFFSDTSIVPGQILRDRVYFHEVEDSNYRRWSREILYRGQELQPGTRVKLFHVRIAFSSEGRVYPSAPNETFEVELHGDQISWDTHGMKFHRVELPPDIYARVMTLAQDDRQQELTLDITAETENGESILLSRQPRGRTYYDAFTELFVNHWTLTHRLGLDSFAIRTFRGPRRMMLAQLFKYTRAKCAEILNMR